MDLQMQKERLFEEMQLEREGHKKQLKQSAALAREEEKRLLAERDLEIKKHQAQP